MRFCVQSKGDQCKPRLCDLVPGTIVGHGAGFYIKVGKRKLCAGISLKWTQDHCVLFNPENGAMIEVDCSVRVSVYAHPANSGDDRYPVVDITQTSRLNAYLRTKSPDIGM